MLTRLPGKVWCLSPHTRAPASPEYILKLDMVGTGYALDAFGKVMAAGGAGLVISSQTGYMYSIPNEIELQILKTRQKN